MFHILMNCGVTTSLLLPADTPIGMCNMSHIVNPLYMLYLVLNMCGHVTYV